MTDRYNFLTVSLEQDIRSDDAQKLIDAIGMLRGVLKVEPNIADGTTYTAEARVRQQIGEKLFDVIYPDRKP